MSRLDLRVVTNVGATLGMLGRGEINFLTTIAAIRRS